MAATQADLDAVERALFQGARRVKYEDREVEYSLKELRALRDQMRQELGLLGTSASRNKLASFSKGT